MKLYPLLSHNIEIVKFLGPITTNPMKQNEQKKSLNTNQRHSTVQCNAMQCICYDTNNCHITHRFIQKSTLRNEWNEELLIFQQKKVFLYYGKLFLYRSLWFVLLQVSKVWHWFFYMNEIYSISNDYFMLAKKDSFKWISKENFLSLKIMVIWF